MEFKRKGPPRGAAGGKSAARPSGDRKPYAGRKPAEGAGPGDRFAPPARGYGARKPGAGPQRDFGARPARGEGKTFGARKPTGEDRSEGYRSGPRARAAQEQRYADAHQRAERPGRSAVISLEPDLARRFPDSAAVNAALRLVLELVELVGPRAARESVASRPALAPRAETHHEVAAAGPRFEDDLDE